MRKISSAAAASRTCATPPLVEDPVPPLVEVSEPPLVEDPSPDAG